MKLPIGWNGSSDEEKLEWLNGNMPVSKDA